MHEYVVVYRVTTRKDGLDLDDFTPREAFVVRVYPVHLVTCDNTSGDVSRRALSQEIAAAEERLLPAIRGLLWSSHNYSATTPLLPRVVRVEVDEEDEEEGGRPRSSRNPSDLELVNLLRAAKRAGLAAAFDAEMHDYGIAFETPKSTYQCFVPLLVVEEVVAQCSLSLPLLTQIPLRQQTTQELLQEEDVQCVPATP